ncbi:hypothetical protein Phi10:1_gp079 [Cellulophaga phage phi10:1]|uniref:Uncharacterized protein n=1 Tax=Cellulophaga phage phi10:1 TaxID=1327981 RepID=S0A0T3_9CAUD|nr:hypothetical protein Phi10:1_gp079 [Cellulophaga phage phi10:1]AGO48420.1 hypothetical protein Phi10:1_gp079 [Cellulophaga phage phi10:1]
MLEVIFDFYDVHSKIQRKKGDRFRPDNGQRRLELLKGGAVIQLRKYRKDDTFRSHIVR